MQPHVSTYNYICDCVYMLKNRLVLVNHFWIVRLRYSNGTLKHFIKASINCGNVSRRTRGFTYF